MRALLVHNPTAGTKGHDTDSIVDALQLADYKVVYVSTKVDDVKGALKEHYDLVVAADGAVGYVFCHLAHPPFRSARDPVPLHILRPAKHPAVKDKESAADTAHGPGAQCG